MYKLKGAKTAVTSATNLGGATAIFVNPNNAGDVTIAANSGTSPYAGSMNVPVNWPFVIQKQATDTIACSASMSCTAIAFHY